MMQIYYYLFYRIYTFYSFLDERESQKERVFSTSLTITTLLVLNLTTLYGKILDLTEMKPSNDSTAIIWAGVIIFIISYLPNHFLFERKSRYQNILGMFSDESPSNRRISSVLTLAFIVLTVFWTIILPILR